MRDIFLDKFIQGHLFDLVSIALRKIGSMSKLKTVIS